MIPSEEVLKLAHRKCTAYDHIPTDKGVQYSFSPRHLIDFAQAICNLHKEGRDALTADIATLEQESRQMRARMDRLERERDMLLTRIDVAREVSVISPAYEKIRATRIFAADDIEYDMFAAGWKAAIDAVKWVA